MSDAERETEELFNKRDAKPTDDTSVGGLHRYWQDRALEAESQLAAANEHIKALMQLDDIYHRHELVGPNENCNCPACNLHHRYGTKLAAAKAEIAKLKAQHKEGAK